MFAEIDALDSLAEALSQVAQLQTRYSAYATPEMQVRGRLIRRIIPKLIEHAIDTGKVQLPTAIPDWKISASDGISAKAQIPWVRLHSQSLSPRATTGCYVVYLFDTAGDRIYLSLSSGAMQMVDGRYYPRPRSSLKQVVTQSRQVLTRQEIDLSTYTNPMDLGRIKSAFGRSYEQSTIASVVYRSQAIPGNDKLWRDLNQLLDYLAMLYE